MNATTTTTPARKRNVQQVDFYGPGAAEQSHLATAWRLAWELSKIYDCGERYKQQLRRNMRDHSLAATKMARIERAEKNAFRDKNEAATIEA